jgi:hypothetical protein
LVKIIEHNSFKEINYDDDDDDYDVSNKETKKNVDQPQPFQNWLHRKKSTRHKILLKSNRILF